MATGRVDRWCWRRAAAVAALLVVAGPPAWALEPPAAPAAIRVAAATAPRAQPARDQTAPRAPSLADFPRALGDTFGRGLFAQANLVPLLVGSGVSGAVAPFDRRTSDRLRGHATALGNAGDLLGGPVGVSTVMGGVLLGVPFTASPRYRAFAFAYFQAMALDTALVVPLKYVVSRERPDGSNHQSFPSGHTSNSFTLAGVVSHYYGRKWGIPIYAFATLVGLSRIEKGRHFTSDVAFGATLGYIASQSAIRATERAGASRRWTVTPAFGPNGAAVFVCVWP